jgi:hypothetical protein
MIAKNAGPPAIKPLHEAYVWCRHFSRDRLVELSGIRRARGWWLDEETIKLSAFSRLQIGNSYQWYRGGRNFDGIWDGREVYFEPNVRPLYIRYAVEVFKQALRDTLGRYPGFTRIEFLDGPLAGERRIVFPDRLDEAATTWLQSRFWQIAEKGEVRVEERYLATFEDNGCRVGNRVKVLLEIDLDRPETNESTWKEICNSLSAGKLPDIDPTPRRCDPRLSVQMLKHLSIPELFALNWEDCLPDLSAADETLIAAAKALDVEGIGSALKGGANPNCFHGKERLTALGLVVEETVHYTWEEGYSEAVAAEMDVRALEAIDRLIDAGAAVDLAGFNENTPLTNACLNSSEKIITKLLECGADPTILCFDDDHIGDLGGAWDYAAYRCCPHANNDDTTGWDVLTRFYPAPFEGVSLPDGS